MLDAILYFVYLWGLVMKTGQTSKVLETCHVIECMMAVFDVTSYVCI